MKYVCNGCGNLVDEEDVIIEFENVYRISVSALCPSCWKKRKESIDRSIDESLKKVSEGSFWRRLIR